MGNKTYAMAQYTRVMDLAALAEHMSAHDSKYNKGDILAVMTQMAECVREQLLLGAKVVLGDLGALSLTLHSRGVDSADVFGVNMIETVRAKWSPGAGLRNLRREASFRFVGTRQSQREARKAERCRLNDLASGRHDATEPDGQPGDGEDPGE